MLNSTTALLAKLQVSKALCDQVAMLRILAIALLISGCNQVVKEDMENILKSGDLGSFKELSEKANPDSLSLIYIPAVTLLLERAEEIKGSPLTESETKRIRDNAQVLASPKDLVQKTLEARGGIE